MTNEFQRYLKTKLLFVMKLSSVVRNINYVLRYCQELKIMQRTQLIAI